MSKKKTKIMYAVLGIVIALAVSIAVIFAVIQKGSNTPPDESTPAVTETTEPMSPDIPVITPNSKGDEDFGKEMPGEVIIDIGNSSEADEKKNTPAVEGEVVIIPGVKGEDE